jgi:hypothetical protein
MNTGPLISDRVLGKLRNVVERTMVYTCDVERPTPTGTKDENNQPLYTWETYLTGQKCAFTTLSGGEKQDNQVAYYISTYKLILPYGTDITVLDRVKNLRDRGGNLVDSTVQRYEIKDRLPSETDITFVIQAIR